MDQLRSMLLHRWAKPLLWLLCLLPLAWLVSRAALSLLGANPAEALIRATGDWTLRSLCLVLLLTPLRIMTRTPALARFRRMLGLFVFFYATLHALCYSGFDMGFDMGDIGRDIAKRPFILVGFSAWVGLSLLALTSFNRAIQWLGARRWRTLHKLVYAVAALALLHFFWMRAGKNNFAEVWVYTAVIAALLGWRVWHALRSRATASRGLMVS
jgi:sulfoxide reductase heme-binding subunit YedZ